MRREVQIAGSHRIDGEIDRLMPLIAQSGYVTAIDAMIPPEVPFAHYIHYVKRMQAIRI